MSKTSAPRLTIVSRGAWRGVEAAVVDTSAGRFVGSARAQPSILLHLGPPAQVQSRYDSAAPARVQRRGDFDIIPAGLAGIWDDHDPTLTMSIWLDAAFLETAAASMTGRGGAARVEPAVAQRDPAIAALAMALKAEMQAEAAADPLFIESVGVALAAKLVQRFGRRETLRAEAQLSKIQLNRVLEHIQANLCGELRLADLARLTGMSASHFRTLFRQTVGRPVHRYVLDQRLQRAQELLQAGEASVTQVALETGFCHQSHLARAMRQKLSLTPSDVRRGRPLSRGWEKSHT